MKKVFFLLFTVGMLFLVFSFSGSIGLGQKEEMTSVIIELRNQPIHEVSKEVSGKYYAEIGELSKQAKQIRAKVEPLDEATIREIGFVKAIEYETFSLSEQDRIRLKQISKEIDYKKGQMRKEIYLKLKERIEPEQREAKKLVESCGGEALGGTVVINSIFARIPISCKEFLESKGYLIHKEQTLYPQLDVSMPAIGAPTWHNNGYKGGEGDIAVIDTGVDFSHPSLTSAKNVSERFHTSAQNNPCYNTNDPENLDTDDFDNYSLIGHGHGTAIAGIIASLDSNYKGVSYGLDTLINGKIGYSCNNSIYGERIDAMLAIDWAIFDVTENQSADVVTYSWGAQYHFYTLFPKYLDAVVDDLDVIVDVSAGNEGPDLSTINYASYAYNVFSVGAVDDNKTVNNSDDKILGFSSRGPTKDGRIKPDIVAPGKGITSTYSVWEISPDFITESGTSLSAPHVGGAALLVLEFMPNARSEVIKALLLNTAFSEGFRSNKTSYGWGILDMTHAYAHRNDVFFSNITSNNSRFYIGNISYGEKATLVWNMHILYVGIDDLNNYTRQRPNLSKLDLYLYDKFGNIIQSSTSDKDNVEQVKADANYTNAVLEIRAKNLHPHDLEEFALATEGNFSLVIGPKLNTSLEVPNNIDDSNFSFVVNFNLENIGDLNVHNISVDLILEDGLNLTSGDNPAKINLTEIGSDETVNWMVNGTDIGMFNLSVNYTGESYGKSLSGSLSATVEIVDDDTEGPVFTNWKGFLNITKGYIVQANITDESNVSSAKIYYDYGNDSVFDGTSLMTNIGGDTWEGVIPKPVSFYNITSFLVEAIDNDNDRVNDKTASNSSLHFIMFPKLVATEGPINAIPVNPIPVPPPPGYESRPYEIPSSNIK